jgi:hypothetical protein
MDSLGFVACIVGLILMSRHAAESSLLGQNVTGFQSPDQFTALRSTDRRRLRRRRVLRYGDHRMPCDCLHRGCDKGKACLSFGRGGLGAVSYGTVRPIEIQHTAVTVICESFVTPEKLVEVDIVVMVVVRSVVMVTVEVGAVIVDVMVG